jgi:hypothetical protein
MFVDFVRAQYLCGLAVTAAGITTTATVTDTPTLSGHSPFPVLQVSEKKLRIVL